MKRVLLVDDEAKVLEALLRHFRPYRREWHVSTASNGAEALRLARERPFDLIITGLLMPEMEGIETVGALRSEHPR